MIYITAILDTDDGDVQIVELNDPRAEYILVGARNFKRLSEDDLPEGALPYVTGLTANDKMVLWEDPRATR